MAPLLPKVSTYFSGDKNYLMPLVSINRSESTLIKKAFDRMYGLFPDPVVVYIKLQLVNHNDCISVEIMAPIYRDILYKT